MSTRGAGPAKIAVAYVNILARVGRRFSSERNTYTTKSVKPGSEYLRNICSVEEKVRHTTMTHL